MIQFNEILVILTFISIISVKFINKSRNIYIVAIISVIEITIPLLKYINFNNVYLYFIKILLLKNSIKYTILVMYILVAVFMSRYIYFINIIINLSIIKIYFIDIMLHKIEDKNKTIEDLKFYSKEDKELQEEIDESNAIQDNLRKKIEKINLDIDNSILNSETAIFILDKDKKLINSNKSFREMAHDKVRDDTNKLYKFLNEKFNEYEKIKYLIENYSEYNKINITDNEENKYEFAISSTFLREKTIIIASIRNITDTYLIENKLRESEENYKGLFGVISEGIVIYKNNEIKYANKVFNNICREHDCKTIDDIIKNMKEDSLDQLKTSIGKNDKAKNTISNIKSTNNKSFEVITTNICLEDEIYFLSIIVDVTDIKDKILKTEESKKTYKLLIKNIPEGIVILDKQDNHIYRNEIGIELMKKIGVENLNNIIKTYKNLNKYGQMEIYKIDTKENIDVGINIVESNNKECIVIFRILDYKYKMEQMELIHDEIDMDETYKSKFMSKLADDIKSNVEYLCNSSKRLTNSDYKNEYLSDYKRIIYQNCFRLKRLINNIKEVDNSKTKLDLNIIRVNDLMENILNHVRYYTDNKGIKIDYINTTSNCKMELDVYKLEKIILNLLSNAIKFTDKNGSIKMTLYENNENVYIGIEDNGIGIEEKYINSVFKKFYQLDNTLSRMSEGTGIGLSVVKRLSDIHNISINVSSQINKGSKFELCIPKDMYLCDTKNTRLDNIEFLSKEKVDIEFSDIYIDDIAT